MFNEQTCKRCGTCLEQCPFLSLSSERAKKEIMSIIENKHSRKIIKACAFCSYCNYICPTGSNPYSLFREIKLKNSHENGVRCLGLISVEITPNLMTVGLEINTDEKLHDLQKYQNPPKSEKMFYVGCAIPYLFSDLVKTKTLLSEYPIMGGMEYCCGGYVNTSFGENEASIKGRELLNKFKRLDIKELITFCPGCDHMIRGVYPSIIKEFDVECKSIIDYFIEKYHDGTLKIKNKIKKRITFQDPCTWRNLDKNIYNAPREFLEIIGAEVVEMKHYKEKSLCCGTPIIIKNPTLGAKIANQRISEAESVNADAIAHICTGCFVTLSNHALKRNIQSYYITELAQMAIGETPAFKIIENQKKLDQNIMKSIKSNPNILKYKYVMKDGKIKRL